MKNKTYPYLNEYELIRSRRKTLALIVTREAKLVVRAPLNLPEKQILDFLIRKKDWIEEKLTLTSRKLPLNKSYNEGDEILFLGNKIELSFVEKPKKLVNLKDKLYVANEYRNRIKGLLIAWYTIEGYAIIPQRVEKIGEKLSLKPKSVKITKAFKRWGSCSSKGSLCFSWRLLMTPLPVIDYVIIHELVHLEIPDHSSRFWKRVESIIPDYRQQKTWLRENDSLLVL
jgi:hypothetical protein